MAIVQQQGGEIGIQKLFTLPGRLMGPVAGKIIDAGSVPGKNYTAVFFLFFGIRLITALAILKLDLKFKKKAKHVFGDAFKVICQFELLSFLLAFFMAGIFWGYLGAFLSIYLDEGLGTTKELIGWTTAITIVVAVPFMLFSGQIMKKIGHSWIMFSALMVYTIRLLSLIHI